MRPWTISDLQRLITTVKLKWSYAEIKFQLCQVGTTFLIKGNDLINFTQIYAILLVGGIKLADLNLISSSEGEIQKNAVFFHGLGGDSLKTWQSDKNPNESMLQWLAKDIKGLAIWTVSYPAATSKWQGPSMHLADRAKNVLDRILIEPGLQTGEIILLGHSLGGLVIKQLLRTAEGMSYKQSEATGLLKRVRRVAFMATPHSGSDLASFADLFRILVRPSSATKDLMDNDSNLRDLNQWYRLWAEKEQIQHLILSETQPLKIAGFIVKPDSSDPGLLTNPTPIDADHLTICKPENRSSEVYLHIRNFIEKSLEIEPKGRIVENISTISQKQIKEIIDLTKESKLHVEAAVTSFSQLVRDEGGKNTERIISELQENELLHRINKSPKYPQKLIDKEIQKQLLVIITARFFPEYPVHDNSLWFAEKICDGEFIGGSDEIKGKSLAWCVRFLSTGKYDVKVDEYLNKAKQFYKGVEIDIAEAFLISAKGEMSEALTKLSQIESSIARTAAFFIIKNHKGAIAAIDWMKQAGISHLELDSDGKYFLYKNLFELGYWDSAKSKIEELEKEDFQSTPALLHSAAMSYLLQVVDDEFKSILLHQLPLELTTFPLAEDEQALKARKKSQELFSKLAIEARELNCKEASNTAEDYALWLELRDPESYNSGIQKLLENMRDPINSLKRLNFALRFGVKLDLLAVEKEIDKQTALSGGGSRDAALARFYLAFTKESPKAIVEYIERNRSQLEDHLGKKFIDILYIEMLSKADMLQQAIAQFNAIKSELSESELTRIQTILDMGSLEADQTGVLIAQFQKSNKLNDLYILVNLLEQQEDYSQICHYGAILFARTKALYDLERLIVALDITNKYSTIISILRQNQYFLELSEKLNFIWIKALYFEGELVEASKLLSQLRDKGDTLNYRNLAVHLAVASGDWETLVTYVENEWLCRCDREASELLQTAHLAQNIGSPRAKELTYAAVQKGERDARILAGAYFLATAAGWEEDKLASKWLVEASKISDSNDGPLKKMTLKELLDQKPEWDLHENKTINQFSAGTLPIFGTAKLLNRTLVDMMLLPALANSSEQDPRKRVIVPAFSGVRKLTTFKFSVVAFDATSLITLVYLRIIEQAFDMFDEVIIPHSTIAWLLEEKQKAISHQPSRIKYAKDLNLLISSGKLKIFKSMGVIDQNLSNEIGDELASLIAETLIGEKSTDKKKFVVCPAPVHRIGSLMEEEADLSEYSSTICSCMAVVNKLKQKGQLTSAEETLAHTFITMNEREWPNEPILPDDAILYLSDLSAMYLQQTGLLKKLQPAGFEAYLSNASIEKINALLQYDNLSTGVIDVIETLRKFLKTGIQRGKIKVGKMPQDEKLKDLKVFHHPCIEIFHSTSDAEALVVDDRFMNQHANFSKDEICKIPIITSLDLINALYLNNKITQNEFYGLLTELRRASFIFVPISKEEIEYHFNSAEIIDGILVETAELKAIRENLLRIRMSDFLQLPHEANWLENILHVCRLVIEFQWTASMDEKIAQARSNWILHIMDLRGWAHSQKIDGGMYIAKFGKGTQLISLIFASAQIPIGQREKYWEWLEIEILINLKEEEPETYKWVIDKVNELIQNTKENPSLMENVNDQ